ncbi:rhomboid family intramembrane serine protease [Luteolibacter sp. Populi]|uniref:rhomboid family intramembrane serine protease n=1 Tax=Luteolibacter sp. Populi TaxID=3230487 RepID=UPI003466DCDA
MTKRGERWRTLAADLRAAKLSLVLVGLMVLIHALVFYPFHGDEIPVGSEWIFESFGLSFEGLGAGKVWQLVTYTFLHGLWVHLLINALGLLLLGARVERISGSFTLLKVFMSASLLGGLAQVLVSQDRLLVGASGGIAGILLWLTTVSPEARAWPIPVSAKNLGRGILISEAGFVIASFFVPPSDIIHVAHACHLGGGIAGWLVGRRSLGPVLSREDLLEERARREAADGPEA